MSDQKGIDLGQPGSEFLSPERTSVVNFLYILSEIIYAQINKYMQKYIIFFTEKLIYITPI